MKKVVIIGSGTAGVLTAGLIKQHYGNNIDVTVVYNKLNESIGVGEGTWPNFSKILTQLEINVRDFFKQTKATVKLGVCLKNWIPETEYFHPFYLKKYTNQLKTNLSSNLYTSYINWELGTYFNLKSVLGHKLSNTVPLSIIDNRKYESSYGFHIDGVLLSQYIRNHLKEKITFIEDEVTDVIFEAESIKDVVLKTHKKITADYYIDCSGFARVLFKKFKQTKWVDVSDILPIDRAIIQQIKTDENLEIPSYTLSEATANGWLWQIPINNNRHGSGYLYCSNFTSDEEAKRDYNEWLNKNHSKNLTSDRIIKFSSGYYEEFCVANCAAIGLSSGFVEPLEATNIRNTIKQIELLLKHDIIFSNAQDNIRLAIEDNKELQENTIKFIDLHYCTNRTDSKFWKYKTSTKSASVKHFEDKCKSVLLDSSILDAGAIIPLDSHILIAKGLGLFNSLGAKKFLSTFHPTLLFQMKANVEFARKQLSLLDQEQISHKKFLNKIIS